MGTLGVQCVQGGKKTKSYSYVTMCVLRMYFKECYSMTANDKIM